VSGLDFCAARQLCQPARLWWKKPYGDFRMGAAACRYSAVRATRNTRSAAWCSKVDIRIFFLWAYCWGRRGVGNQMRSEMNYFRAAEVCWGFSRIGYARACSLWKVRCLRIGEVRTMVGVRGWRPQRETLRQRKLRRTMMTCAKIAGARS